MDRKRKKQVIIIIGALFILGIIMLLIQSGIFKSSEDYLREGNYQKAYDKAKDEKQKENILRENTTAVLLVKISRKVDTPKTLKLRNAYEPDGARGKTAGEYFVVYVDGGDTLGNVAGNYYVYRSDGKNGSWKLLDKVVTLEYESMRKLDKYAEKIFGKLKNYKKEKHREKPRDIILRAKKAGQSLDKGSVQRINEFFQEGKLDEVKAISVD